MSFFITSQGSGKGADFGGLAGADAHCQKLAAAAGAGGKTWRAYLSVPGDLSFGQRPACFGQCARPHRPGPLVQRQGPADRATWRTCTTATHQQGNGADEKGQHPVKGRGDTPNEHDILTGSAAPTARPSHRRPTPPARPGRAAPTARPSSATTTASARCPNFNWAKSWNFSHQSAGAARRRWCTPKTHGRVRAGFTALPVN
jgi:hypothetical protein